MERYDESPSHRKQGQTLEERRRLSVVWVRFLLEVELRDVLVLLHDVDDHVHYVGDHVLDFEELLGESNEEIGDGEVDEVLGDFGFDVKVGAADFEVESDELEEQ